ncbi:hypothetical protein ACHAWF_002780, partial [Thalassiosira exigua]
PAHDPALCVLRPPDRRTPTTAPDPTQGGRSRPRPGAARRRRPAGDVRILLSFPLHGLQDRTEDEEMKHRVLLGACLALPTPCRAFAFAANASPGPTATAGVAAGASATTKAAFATALGRSGSPPIRSGTALASRRGGPDASSSSSREEPSFFSRSLADLRTAASDGFGTRARNVGSTMAAGDVVVPLCSNLDKRQSLAQRGLYAGVEYVLCDVEEADGGEGRRLVSGRVATLKPAYPLRPHLERADWPVSIPVSDVPLWLPKSTYEAGTALGTLILAGTYLGVAAFLAAFVRVAVVPSESMTPALMPGDVVLVTRSIFAKPNVNDVVFFDPPRELDEAVASSEVGRAAAAEKVPLASTKGKQFLKRVAAVPGERVGVVDGDPYVPLACDDRARGDCPYRVDRTGAYSRPDVFSAESWDRAPATLPEGQYFVAGDNGYRSVDSRVWGPMKENYLFGTARWILYPNFGPIRPGPIAVERSVQNLDVQME